MSLEDLKARMQRAAMAKAEEINAAKKVEDTRIRGRRRRGMGEKRQPKVVTLATQPVTSSPDVTHQPPSAPVAELVPAVVPAPIAATAEPTPVAVAEPLVTIEQENPPKNWEEIFGHTPEAGDILKLTSKTGKRVQELYYDTDIKELVSKSGQVYSSDQISNKKDKGWKYVVLSGTIPSVKKVPNTPDISVAAAERTPLSGDPEVNAAIALRNSERILSEKEEGDDKAVLTITPQVVGDKNENFALGKVFADEYLDLNPPHSEQEERGVGYKADSSAKNEDKEETLEEKVSQLKKEVEDLRAGYAKADYDETNAWARVKKFFGKTLKGIDERQWQEKEYNKSTTYAENATSYQKTSYGDGAYWQAQYKNKLVDLENAQLELIKERAGEGKGWKTAMADMIKYFDVDEVTNLIDARTQYRAGKQNWPTKVFDSFNALGREYNKLSMKQKLAITAACAGGTIALTLTGGAAAGVAALLVMGGKRVLASAGLTVGTEALLDSSRTKYRAKETEKEIEKLFTETPEQGFDYLNKVIRKKALAIDEELDKAKLTKLLHKAGALTVGIAVGSGWLSQIVMDKWGGNEAFGWVKERIGNVFGGAHIAHPSLVVHPNISAPVEQIPAVPVVPTTVAGIGDVPVAEPGAVPPTAPDIETESIEYGMPLSTEPNVVPVNFIDNFVNQDYVVQKGDSVWKIAGRLADQIGVEGPQRTHFIDTLKDQYGDVLLKEGEVINFAAHGIDADFVDHALGQTSVLTPEQLVSIAANDAKIAEFVAVHPDVTLTNESVDAILQGGSMDNISAVAVPDTAAGANIIANSPTPDLQGADGANIPTAEVPDSPADDGETLNVAETNESPLKTADIRYDRDIILGSKYDVAEYKKFFQLNPDAFTHFKKMGEAYMGFIFEGNQNVMDDIGGKTFSELESFPNGSFEKFVKMAEETYGSKFGLPNPKEKVYEYIARMTMLGMEYPGAKRIILPEYT